MGGALCTTEGSLGGAATSFFIQDAAFRASMPGSDGHRAILAFDSLAPVADPVELADGEVRHQLGVRLLSANACNVLYVMWRMDDPTAIVVQAKRNPGLTKSSQCGAGGYATIAPQYRAPVPSAWAGDRHVMDAAISTGVLEIRIDGAIAWSADVSEATTGMSGIAGVRSDNVSFNASFSAPLDCSSIVNQ
jgi:hypothetical protein